jgi:hypothetical protein
LARLSEQELVSLVAVTVWPVFHPEMVRFEELARRQAADRRHVVDRPLQ